MSNDSYLDTLQDLKNHKSYHKLNKENQQKHQCRQTTGNFMLLNWKKHMFYQC